jgi:hypothetical protein
MRDILVSIKKGISLGLFHYLISIGGWNVVHYYQDGTWTVNSGKHENLMGKVNSSDTVPTKTLFMRPCSPSYMLENGEMRKIQ